MKIGDFLKCKDCRGNNWRIRVEADYLELQCHKCDDVTSFKFEEKQEDDGDE